MRRVPPLWLVPLLGVVVSAYAASDDLPTAWEQVARHLPAEAAARLKHTPASASREAAFAHAVVALDTQPVTDERLREISTQLLQLARGDDEVARASGYLAGRIYQAHFFQADPARAAAIYEELIRRFPTDPWAQLALVKLAVLKLYVLPEPNGPAARAATAESYLPRMSIPSLQRDLHLAIGRARLFHQLPGFLPHLVAAAEIGGLAGLPRADLQIQIGELSRRAGQYEQAEKYFRQFLAENEVDGRAFAVRAKLAEMSAARKSAGATP